MKTSALLSALALLATSAAATTTTGPVTYTPTTVATGPLSSTPTTVASSTPTTVASATPTTTPVAVQVTYDQTYDVGSNSLEIVACSNGVNGLLTRGFTNFASLPNFPYIGGAFFGNFNSTECGSCWELRTETNSINVTVIDLSAGFNIALEALNALTNNNAVDLGKVNATATQLPPSSCGMQ